jgi:hypothetical protein
MKLFTPKTDVHRWFLAAALLYSGVAAAATAPLWSDDFESGSTSKWSSGGGGGEFNSGSGDSVSSRDRAHGGSWGLKMTISTPPESGTRMFRWHEPQTNPKLYYSVWYYFPQQYSVTNYWNVFQWKSKRSSGQVDPFFVLNVGNRPDGSMYFYLYNWQKRQSYTQAVKNVPVGQWFKVEAYYASAPDGTGRVTFWQDGTQLFDVNNVQTRYSDGDCQWSVDNYSDGVRPSPAAIYIDDAAISTTRDSSPSPAPAPLSITTSSLPNGTVGTAYSHNLTATGGTTPYSWSASSGALPPGLAVDNAGRISGTPTAAGTYSAAFKVTDSGGPPQTATSALLNLTVAGSSSPPAGPTLWSADFETGDTSQWYAPSTGPNGNEGGGEFNSGQGDSAASRDRAHSGSWSLKMQVTTPPESGTRMFRWKEPQKYPKLQYSAWYYFPQRYSVARYWNVFQWKSKRSSGQVDPFFVLNVANRPDGSMYFYLYNWQKRQSFTQAVKNVPVGQWFKVEAYYACAADGTGRVTFWQDGTQLFDVQNVQTRYSDGDCQWSVDNYSDGVTPSPTAIYIDDAAIVQK